MDESMRAAVYTHYGPPDVVEIRNAPKPTAKAGEVLIRIHATTVNRTDRGMLRARPFFIRAMLGLRRPKRTILGMDFASVIEAVSAGVTSFEPGERVFGMSPDEFGAHAEYLCLPEDGAIAAMPSGRQLRRGRPLRGRLVRGHLPQGPPSPARTQDPHLRGIRRHWPQRRCSSRSASGPR